MRRASLSVATTLTLLACAAPCLAQEAEVTVSTPAPPAAAVVVAPAGPAAAAPTKAEDKKREEKKDEEEKDTAHFRFGMGLDANYVILSGSGGYQGAAAGIQVRLGAQINQWFAVYYQPHFILGGTVSQAASPVPGVMLPTANAIGEVYNSALIEATLPALHVGAGPSIDVVGIDNFGLMSPMGTISTSVYFGIEGRAALVIGGHGPGRHVGFAINANVHPTFFNGDVLTTFSLGIGGEMY